MSKLYRDGGMRKLMNLVHFHQPYSSFTLCAFSMLHVADRNNWYLSRVKAIDIAVKAVHL